MTRAPQLLSITISPENEIDSDGLMSALGVLAKEDRNFRIKIDQDTGQITLSGENEEHLDTLIDRLLHEFKLSLSTCSVSQVLCKC